MPAGALQFHSDTVRLELAGLSQGKGLLLQPSPTSDANQKAGPPVLPASLL